MMRRARTTTGLAGTAAVLLLLATPSPGQLEITPPTSEPRTADEMSEWDRPIPEGREVLTLEVVPIGGLRVLVFVQLRGLGRTTMSGTASILEVDLSTGEWAARHPFAWRVQPIAPTEGRVVCIVSESAQEHAATASGLSIWLLDTRTWIATPFLEPGPHEDGANPRFMIPQGAAIAQDGRHMLVHGRRFDPSTNLPKSAVIIFNTETMQPMLHESWGPLLLAAFSANGPDLLRVRYQYELPPSEIGRFKHTSKTLLERIDIATGDTRTTEISMPTAWRFARADIADSIATTTMDLDRGVSRLKIVDPDSGAALKSAEYRGITFLEPTSWPRSGILVPFESIEQRGKTGVMLFNDDAEEIGRWTFPGKVISSWFSLPGEEHPYAVVDNEDIVQLLPGGVFRPVWSLRLLEK